MPGMFDEIDKMGSGNEDAFRENMEPMARMVVLWYKILVEQGMPPEVANVHSIEMQRALVNLAFATAPKKGGQK